MNEIQKHQADIVDSVADTAREKLVAQNPESAKEIKDEKELQKNLAQLHEFATLQHGEDTHLHELKINALNQALNEVATEYQQNENIPPEATKKLVSLYVRSTDKNSYLSTETVAKLFDKYSLEEIQGWEALYLGALNYKRVTEKMMMPHHIFIEGIFAPLINGNMPEQSFLDNIDFSEEAIQNLIEGNPKVKAVLKGVVMGMTPGTDIAQHGLFDEAGNIKWGVLGTEGMKTLSIVAMILSGGLASGTLVGKAALAAKTVVAVDTAGAVIHTPQMFKEAARAMDQGNVGETAMYITMGAMPLVAPTTLGIGKLKGKNPKAQPKFDGDDVDTSFIKPDSEQYGTPTRTKDKPSPEEVLENAKLDSAARLQKAEELLGRELTETQKQAIVDAHEIGIGKGVYEYSQRDIAQKARILKGSDFDETERRILIKHGIAGDISPKIEAYFNQTVNIRRSDGSIAQAEITSYDPNTGKFLATWTENGKGRGMPVTLKQLDDLNQPKKVASSPSSEVQKYFEQGIVNIRRNDGSIQQAEIIAYDEGSGKFLVEWTENGQEVKRKEVTLRQLNNVDQPANIRQHPEKNLVNSKERIAIGDSNGDLGTYLWNMEHAGVIDRNAKWAAGDKTVTVHGDILGDRGMDGFAILKENAKLRKQARAQGGDIITIAGNHEDLVFSWLLQRDGQLFTNYPKQSMGMKEFTKFSGDGSMPKGNALDAAYAFNRLKRDEVLNNMRNSPEGRFLLEEMCNMKLCERVGNRIHLHTDPTDEILELLVTEGVDSINNRFQRAMRDTLLEGKPFDARNNDIFDTFLDTSNRTLVNSDRVDGMVLYDQSLIDALREQGIEGFVFGHSNLGQGNRVLNIQGMHFVNIDQSSLRGGRNTVNAARMDDDSLETGTQMIR